MRLALLKAPLPGLRHQLAHRLGTAIDHSQYSHSNLVFSGGKSGSAWADGGVQIREVEYDPALWDFYTLPSALEPKAHAWFSWNTGAGYDRFGVLRFGLSLLQQSPGRYFCHEAIAAALGWSDAWRYGPGLLLARCTDHLGSVPCADPWASQYTIHPEVRKAGRA